ncbi:hypothetical protein PoB_007204200 [Plakobranchus ocellatus]|uniref:Nucleotide-diphospho-sugar transferase domain-containing protein n=1 Tax=Plakobranchus ocellatus TaxID=259542 RepID=A0AAV4DMN6_9GAST|nr:hypothetical protein PoB_007204200 [Plakobranchus ocellatus]
MKTNGSCSRQRPCRRCVSSYNASLAIGTAFFLLLVYLMMEELTSYASESGSHSQLNITRWIIPVHNLDAKIMMDGIPEGWMLLLPTGANLSCSRCVQDDSVRVNDAFSQHNRHHVTSEAVYSHMLPVLFAIKGGAQQIVLSSNTSDLKSSMQKLFIDNEPYGVVGLEYFGSALTLDSHHFHHRSEVEKAPVCKYRLRKCMNPLWTLGLRCKLTKQAIIQQDIILDEQAPPVFASSPKFSIQMIEDALFQRTGFWSMFVAFVEPGEEASVWSLWAQRLMMELSAETGLVVLPCPQGAPHAKVPTNLNDASQSVFHLVNTWKCPRERDFFDCAVTLAGQLRRDGYVTQVALDALYVWLAELWVLGYTPPQRRQRKPCPERPVKEGCIIHHPALSVLGGRAGLAPYQTPQKLFPAIETRCSNQSKRAGVSDPFLPYILDPEGSSKVRDLALVLIFYDSSIYNNIIFLEDLHRKYFNQIIYCGPVAAHFSIFYSEIKRPFSYIEVPHTRGFVAHDCLTRAVMMNYGVSGYLEIADDVILNTWSLGSIPRDRFWFQKDLRVASRYVQMMQDFAVSHPVAWWPWTIDGQKWGAKAMANVWNSLREIGSNGSIAARETVRSFLQMLQHNSGHPDNFFYSSSDIFYVPAVFRRSWIFLGDIFIRNNVFLDVAVPTLMNGVDLISNIVRMDGVYLWYNNRANYPAHYRGFHNFFHPWKMGWIHQADHAYFMCYFILPFIVDDLVQGKQAKGAKSSMFKKVK